MQRVEDDGCQKYFILNASERVLGWYVTRLCSSLAKSMSMCFRRK